MGRHRPPDDGSWPHPDDGAAHARHGDDPGTTEFARPRGTRILLCTTAARDVWARLTAEDPRTATGVWDALAEPPAQESAGWVRLRGDLADIDLDGGRFPRRQFRVGGLRVWFTVRTRSDGHDVLVERIDRED
ncbi:hypothetical protein [Tsukamurella sp. 1534]|uniref:hypothetical protein n=1 Tax=Tsukamurella sp. 1534 TaxID=1151061 RepID=UPI0002DD81E0|nr:hypothetical protein [Tsukamurella sp. 1534]